MPQIQLIVFPGNRTIDRGEEHPLVRIGHAGISFDNGTTIYGFSPSTEAYNWYRNQAEATIGSHGGSFGDVDKEAEKLLIRHLLHRYAIRGQVRNDTPRFNRVQELYQESFEESDQEKLHIPVRATWLSDQLTDERLRALEDEVERLAHNPTAVVSWYSLPVGSETDETPMPRGCNNCLTWPRTLGLTLPDNTGWSARIESILDQREATGEAWIW
jgi:hypothetical protein